MAEEICPSIYAFPGRKFDCYSYLLVEDTAILVDPGTGLFFSELANSLARNGWPPNKINAIVNTHCHFDHAGGNYLFRCPVYAREPDLSAIRGEKQELTLAANFGMEFQPVKALPIPDEFHGWRVISTPGHTLGSISLYNKSKKVLVSGDTLFPDGVGRTDLPGGDEHALQKSLKTLRALKYDFLLSGHGIGAKSF